MSAFLYGVLLQWKLDARNKSTVLTFYAVPLVFFGFMGGIFTSIDPLAKNSIVQSMTIFAVTMGAFLGSPMPLVEFYGSDIRKAYKISGIPDGISIINNIISGFIHLFIVSLIIFFIAPFLFDASVPNNTPLYFIVLVIFIFTCLLVGTVLGLLVKDSSKLTMVSQLLFLPSIMLSGIMFPANMLPKPFEYVGNILPATWAYYNMIRDSFSELFILPFILIIIIAIVIITFKIKHLEKNN